MVTPDGRAERLLRDVLGEARFGRLRTEGYLDLPSGRFPGRVYRLDNFGNLSYRDPGEGTFNTTLCVQPEECVPRDDMVAARYLLVTADEERLLEVANPINFGFVSLARTLYHDFARRYPRWLAALATFGLLALFLGALGVEAWALVALRSASPVLAVLCSIVFLLPALVGLLLLAAGGVEIVRTLRTWRARSALSAAG